MHAKIYTLYSLLALEEAVPSYGRVGICGGLAGAVKDEINRMHTQQYFTYLQQ